MRDVLTDMIKDTMKNDKVLLQDLADLAELESRYQKLKLTREQRYVIESYIACFHTVSERCAQIAYVAGLKKE